MTPEGPSPLFEDLLVLDFSTMIMVPAAAGLMADYGARVIKIEPLNGELNRRGHLIPGMPLHTREYCSYSDNRNKQSLAVDLKAPEGMAIFLELARRADVSFTNLRARALLRLGLDYASLRSINPGLIYAHGTGYGDAGAEADQPGFDAVCYWARSGLELSFFPEDGYPGNPTYGSGDHPSGMALFAAVLMALLHRQKTGEGQRVSTSLLANGAWANSVLIQAQLVGAEFQERLPRENPRNFAAVYYRAGDGQPFKITAVDHEATWPKLCRAAGLEELIDDPRYSTMQARSQRMGELVRRFDEVFARKTLEYWRRRCRDCDVPFSALSTYEDVAVDEQMAANGVFCEVPDPERSGPDETSFVRTVDSPIRLGAGLRAAPQSPPRLGQHTAEVLREIGVSARDIGNLAERGIVVVDEAHRVEDSVD